MVLLQRLWGLPGEETNPHFFWSFLDTPWDPIRSVWLLTKEDQERKQKLQSSVHLIPLLQCTLSWGQSCSSFCTEQGLGFCFAMCRSSHSLFILLYVLWICLMYIFRRRKGTVFPQGVKPINWFIKGCLVSGSTTYTTLLKRIAVLVSQCVPLLRTFTSLLLCFSSLGIVGWCEMHLWTFQPPLVSEHTCFYQMLLWGLEWG